MATLLSAPSQDGYWFLALPLLAGPSSSLAMFFSLWPVCLAVSLIVVSSALLTWASPGGPAWGSLTSKCTIPGPRGFPFLGSLLDMGSLAHRRLAALARHHNARSLMAFSLGSTRVVISSNPEVAKELLSKPGFADRPLKQSAQQLLFGRAIGFAPYGEYWRKLRRIAATHLFSPNRIAAHETQRQAETTAMLEALTRVSALNGGPVQVRPFLQRAALNNIMVTVFGRRYDFGSDCPESKELQNMVREGFELLGAFNMADHLPALRAIDPLHIHERCAALVPRVHAFVQNIIDDHKQRLRNDESSDFVDVLLSMQQEENLADVDMVAILWEMIFRGTDTMAILTEWILAELVLHPEVQEKLHAELDAVCRGCNTKDSDIARMPYLQAVVKETLRIHPPGPLLSWARLAANDVELAGHSIPAGTTAMVNMWAITHDSSIWEQPDEFKPERFVESEGGLDIDIRGSDLRLAPFGAGRRVCPGKALGLATVNLWIARLLQQFRWGVDPNQPVDLSEMLKLSCEMVYPLSTIPVSRC